MDLQNKTVVLTGATGGIGRPLAAKLAAKGARLALVASRAYKLRQLAQSLGATAFPADLTNPTARAELIHTLRDQFPRLDVLINGAGIGIYKPYHELTATQWYTSYELNLHTPFFLTQELSPDLTLNLGSCSAVQHRPQRALYNSTKAALRTMTLCMAQDTPRKLVHLTLDSTLTPFGPLTLADKKAQEVNGKQYLSPAWVTGQIIAILEDDSRQAEYVLSPDCYDHCGTWHKP